MAYLNISSHAYIYSVYQHMAEPGEVLDCLDQADSWPADLELVGSLAGPLQEEPVQDLQAREDCFRLESQVQDNNSTQLYIYSVYLYMAEPGEVLDCFDQLYTWPADLELVDSLARPKEPVPDHEARDLKDCFELES